jgi:hypothetical protein
MNYIFFNEKFNNKISQALDQIRKASRDISDIHQAKIEFDEKEWTSWIDVKDKLPREKIWVLVKCCAWHFSPNHKPQTAFLIHSTFHENDRFNNEIHNFVTHWMYIAAEKSPWWLSDYDL